MGKALTEKRAHLSLILLQLDRHYRPAPQPHFRGPLAVRSVGAYQVPAGWREQQRSRPFSELFWVETGCLQIEGPGGPQTVAAEEVWVYHPLEPHRLTALAATRYYWLTFDGWAHREALWGPGATDRRWRVGRPPTEIFAQLATTVASPWPEAEQGAVRLAQDLLWRVSGGLGRPRFDPREPPEVQQWQEAMDASFRQVDFDQSSLAAHSHRHRTTLFRQFTRHRGLTPSAYLRRQRLAEALRLLRETSLPVAEVASASGFRDPAYLSQVIRAATGFTPTALRATGQRPR